MAEGLGEGARGQGPCWLKTCLLLLDYFRAHRCQPRLVPETGGGASRQLARVRSADGVTKLKKLAPTNFVSL